MVWYFYKFKVIDEHGKAVRKGSGTIESNEAPNIIHKKIEDKLTRDFVKSFLSGEKVLITKFNRI